MKYILQQLLRELDTILFQKISGKLIHRETARQYLLKKTGEILDSARPETVGLQPDMSD